MRAPRRVGFVLFVGLLAGACGTISTSAPVPTPAGFPGIASVLSDRGIAVTNIVSGDAGCDDPTIAKTAIGFDAAGADQTAPVRVHIFIFRNRDTYLRQRAAVDECAKAFVTDPATYETEESSPYVAAGQGPWAPGFKERLRAALVQAAGTGD